MKIPFPIRCCIPAGRFSAPNLTPLSDLYQSPLDLKRPDNLRISGSLQRYPRPLYHRQPHGLNLAFGSYHAHSERVSCMTEQQQRNSYFRKQNDEIFQAKGGRSSTSPICTSTLGPAEKSSVLVASIEDAGFAELKFGIQQENYRQPFAVYPVTETR